MEFDNIKLEKYSSAISLSDMEIFVFPELMYSLLLANIMSPQIWNWKQEDTFKKLEGKSVNRTFSRMKQYIMDNYEFNLDLETWGLTNSEKELDRFKDVISPEQIARSNALFGYTGDKYYFDVDIRKHFGLDKYTTETIPYWKTETLEAMNAFRYKQGYTTGAGECVSLAALYASATFVICGIPLEDIYMILTPLHSQNYIDLNDGIITNNRRIVTKTMWFNGTALSAKAQRALRNEKVTIVAHNTGYIHTLYDEATIDPDVYKGFTDKLKTYLTADLDLLNLVNFLRTHNEYHKYFQFCRHFRGTPKFVTAETMFMYEHGSNFRIADDTYDKLLEEIEEDDFTTYKAIDRVCCEQLRQFLNKKKIDLKIPEHKKILVNHLTPFVPIAEKFVDDLADFLAIQPQLPSPEKKYSDTSQIKITPDMDRQDIIDYLSEIRKTNTLADLAFYAYRDMDSCDWKPFIKAAIERNPVSIAVSQDKSIDDAYTWLKEMENNSIYDDNRMAQPDEVINFLRGDGTEKAITLANIIKEKTPETEVEITIDNSNVILKAGKEYQFNSNKSIQKQLEI